MKLTKILILTLALMTIAATVSFADVNFISSAGNRIIQVNAQTGMTSTIELSAVGPFGTPSVSANESIFLSYNADISALYDIQIRVKGDSTAPGAFAAVGAGYNVFVPLTGPDLTLAEARVGIQSGDRRTIQIRFTAPVLFTLQDSIEIAGVRVDAASVFPMDVPGSNVEVDFTNAIGQAVVTNGSKLQVAVTAEPMSITAPATSINFQATGGMDIATVTLNELFTNAFETRVEEPLTEILLTVGDIPDGVDFVGISNVMGATGTIAAHDCSSSAVLLANQALICIDSQTEGLFESIQVGLQFALVDTPAFSPSPASVTATLYPPGPTLPMPYPLPLRYANHIRTAAISFGVQAVTGGRLLSTFNAVIHESAGSEALVMETGIAIMNGSGAAGMFPLVIGQAGTVTVNMYPLDGSGPYTFTTSATMRPGLGLDVNGRVPPKGSWAVLVSQFLPYAENADNETIAGDFEGFIIFTADFPNAEGVSYITDNNFEAYAQGYQMINLVLRDAESTARNTINSIYNLLVP